MQLPTLSSTPASGQVTLVGAGPGDPELLTLKALKAIQQATVLLVDDLVGADIVALASPGARVIHVGKRGGCHSTPQAFIERLMVTAALEGESVVRLKGGDPFIFGRGGEEAEHLQAAGVRVSVVNGITSGLAAASALGIPLTHRDQAQGVLFVTGHTKRGEPEADWPSLGMLAHKNKLTLVIYMGIHGAAAIQSGLLQGLSPDTPVALVQNASRPEQRHASCLLANLQSTVQAHAIASPAIIVVGEVARARSREPEVYSGDWSGSGVDGDVAHWAS
jgi:uroporphyrin-III C-methyltransferase